MLDCYSRPAKQLTITALPIEFPLGFATQIPVVRCSGGSAFTLRLALGQRLRFVVRVLVLLSASLKVPRNVQILTTVAVRAPLGLLPSRTRGGRHDLRLSREPVSTVLPLHRLVSVRNDAGIRPTLDDAVVHLLVATTSASGACRFACARFVQTRLVISQLLRHSLRTRLRSVSHSLCNASTCRWPTV